MKSIRTKLFITYAGLLLLAVMLLGIGFTWFTRTFYMETVRERLVEEARVTGELLKPVLAEHLENGDRQDTDDFIDQLGQRTNARITLVTSDGVVLGDSAEVARQMDNHLLRPEIRSAAEGEPGSAIRYSRTVGANMLYVAVSLGEAGEELGFLRLAVPLADLNTALWRVQYGLVAGLLLVLLISLGISLRLSESLTRPLAEIAKVSRQISKGELTSRLSVTGKDEIGSLARSVNSMAESLEQQVEKVMANHDQLKTILSTMVEGILVFDQEGKVTLANPAAEHMLGLQKNSWLGRRGLEIVRNNELHEKILLVGSDKVFQEHEINIKLPENRVLSFNLAPIENSGVLAVFHDITKLRHLEEMRADFAANVSHELRTPLTAIRGFAETLLDGAYSDPQAAQRFAEILHREALRLERLIEDVLNLSQIESGKIKIADTPVDIAGLVHEVTNRFDQLLQNYSLQVEIPAEIPAVTGDLGLLSQALYNLLDNALKYTPNGGTILVSASVDKNVVRLCVADSGMGIPPEAQERIFERFYRADKARSRRLGGTGLGLAIVKHIVDAHHGQVQLESEEGKGTSVSLLLPAYHDTKNDSAE